MMVRCIHLDMKSMFPKAEYLLKELDQLAGLGYTHILLEFEDRFPFEAYPDFVRKSAYTREEFRCVAGKCRQLGIGVIPLLQCAGHLDYFLKEPAYRKWSENGDTFQWCLSDTETLEVWKSMAQEILDIFPDCEYFHIGADEVKHRDPCPACARKDPFGLYLGRVRACTDHLLDKGKKVLAWDDMFRNHDLKESGDLLRKVIPCVWQYRQMDESIIRRYAEAGIRYWGVSRIQTDTVFYRGMGRQQMMQKNVDDWAGIQEKYPAEGHIGTIWGRIQSLYPINTTLPQSMFMAGYLAGERMELYDLAESLLHGKIKDRAAFNRSFAENFFGLPELDMDQLALNFAIESAPVKTELERWLGKALRNNDVLENWHAFNEIDDLYAYVDQCFNNNKASLGKYRAGQVTDAMLRNWLDGVRITRERVKKLSAWLDTVLGKYFPQDQLDEFKCERFESLLETNEQWGRFLQETARKPHYSANGTLFRS